MHAVREHQLGIGAKSSKEAVQKRLESNLKNRKSTRLTAFDNARNLERCSSPAPPPMSEAQLKMEHRRQQLEKWKLEKEQKKKVQAAQKKKPFLAGVPRNPLNFVPPPPPPKPSTSGRVTRSQTRSTVSKQKTKSPVKPTAKGRSMQSFAPKNASFKPPEIKNLAKLPKLAPVSKSKSRKTTTITFDPVVPNAVTAKQTRSRPTLTRQYATETKFNTQPKTESRSTIRGKVTKKLSPKRAAKKPITSSSSGSGVESAKIIHRVQTPGPRKSLKEPKELTPKQLLMESTSSEKSSGESGGTTSRRKSATRSVASVKDSQSSSDNITSDIDPSSAEEQTTIRVNNRNRKSMRKNFSPRTWTSDSSSDKICSDAEFGQDESPIVLLRRSLPCTPRNMGVPKSESSSEEKLRSPKSPIEVPLSPEQMESAKISPCVTFSRGKDNARKEMKWKIDEGYLDDDVSDMDSVDHFRKQLSSEIKRMTEMCDTWDKILAQTVLPETVQEAVLSAVGQARLLMSQKLQQFASLVERCAKPEPGTALVTPADLHGFWDMVFMQVENVDLRFKKLEELRSRNWAEDKPPAEAYVAGKRPSKQPARAARPKGNSRLREMIAAARKAKKDLGQLCSSSDDSSSPAPPAEGEKTFEAGFFCVRSPVRSPSSPAKPSPATPAGRSTLLKAVLSSEAKKASTSKNSTPFAMLRASIIGKSVECEGFAPLPQTPQMTPLNLFATPGRSILKSTTKSGKKSIKVVLFDDSDDSDPQYQSCVRDSAQSTISGVKIIEDPEATTVQDKENSPIIEVSSRTRSQRKSLQNLSNIEDTSVTEVKTPRRSSRKKNAEDVMEKKTEKKTPSKQSGRKKTTKDTDLSIEIVEKRKKSTRNKTLKELEISALEDVIPTPKRSSRRNKAQVC